MVENLFISLNEQFQQMIEALPEEDLGKLREDIATAVDRFMRSDHRPEDVLKLSRNLARVHPSGAVVSHYIENKSLHLFVDFIEPEQASQFYYTHTRIH